MSQTGIEDDSAAGRLIAIGGLADRARERELLRAFYEAAGGPDANLVVLALAAEPAEIRDLAVAAERFGDVFYDLGAESVEVLRLGTASGRSRLDLLDYATGLFLAGGGPSWLPLPDEVPLGEVVRRRHREGLVVGGNGGGAAVLPALSIAPVPASAALGAGPPPGPGRRRSLALAPGLGLVHGLLLDPPSRQRDRLGRLLTALALDPAPLALGIDDDTALVIDPAAGGFEVLGAGAVMVVDAAAALRPGEGPPAGPPSMLGLSDDILTAGCRYDLRQRRARPGAVHGTERRLVEPLAEPGD